MDTVFAPDSQQSVLVVIEEGSPSRERFPVGNRQYAVTVRNLADFFMADPVAELFQFASDAIIAQTILSGELEHQLDDLGLDRGSTDFLQLLVEGRLAFDQLTMPAEEGIGFEDQDQLLQLGFRQTDDRSESLNQSQQHQLLSAGDGWTAFLMTPHDQKLLTKNQQFEGIVVGRQATEAKTVTE